MVAVVGRPNVGKSCLFNRLIGRRQAIVHDLPGVTRDRLVGEVEWEGVRFQASDTGGIAPGSAEGGIEAAVEAQALQAASEAALVVLVVDGRQGLTPVDEEIARRLHTLGSDRLLLAVNKLDTIQHAALVADFMALGFTTIVPISAEHGLGVDDLLDAIIARLPKDESLPSETEPEEAIPVALIGRPNVGKSTLFNQLIGDERSIVSELAGTTRDTVDVCAERDGVRLCYLDTAGIRRKGKTEQGPEVLSMVMARKAIERSEVVVLVLDATQEISHQDAVVAGLADELGKGIVIAFTKWDLIAAGEQRRAELDQQVADHLKFLAYAPRVTVSGRTGRGLTKLVRLIARVDAARRREVATPVLNRLVERQFADLNLMAPGAKSARILYATQTGIRPPTFTFFANRRIAPHFSTVRFIQNRLREAFQLEGTPVKVRFRSKQER